MRNRYTAVVQRDGRWLIAFCPEVPEANGQRKTREECLESLAAAIELVLDYKREQGLENGARGAEQTKVSRNWGACGNGCQHLKSVLRRGLLVMGAVPSPCQPGPAGNQPRLSAPPFPPRPNPVPMPYL